MIQAQTQLANLFRPRHLDELKGQEIPVRILRNFLRGRRDDGVPVSMPSVLFLAGESGTGKTTAARAIAAAATCPKFNAETVRGCGQCPDCVAALGGVANARNFLFLDPTAANSKSLVVDSLKHFVRTAPAGGARRVVCIADEAHTFSSAAKDALLTISENLPPTALLVYTSMEAHSVDEAVMNRAVVIEFSSLTEEQMVESAMALCEPADVPGILVVAKAAGGSMRQFWSLLQKVHAAADGDITEDVARRVLGLASTSAINHLADAIVNAQFARIHSGWAYVRRQGLNESAVMMQLEDELVARAAAEPLARNWPSALATLSFAVVQNRPDRYVIAMVAAAGLLSEHEATLKQTAIADHINAAVARVLSVDASPLLTGRKDPAQAQDVDTALLWAKEGHR